MTGPMDLSARLKAALRMELEPVGVRVYGRDETPSAELDGFDPPQALKSYCQALTRAGRGETFFAGAARLGCVLGTSTLGLEDDPAPLLNDSVTEKFGAGLFETEAASRASIEAARKFESGRNRAVLIGPLGRMPEEPQVVIVELDPEQTMWLLYADNYHGGGPQALPQSGGVAGGCADITVWPLSENQTNVTFLGLGCRLKSAIPPIHLLAGFPCTRLGDIVESLEKMAKPMAKLAQAREGD
ncbi:MAG: DUF169 domain-containing protein [Proteobacteria bacterium]|nr:DUF169 domain-containing protein [Pseudomonadota bacterium]